MLSSRRGLGFECPPVWCLRLCNVVNFPQKGQGPLGTVAEEGVTLRSVSSTFSFRGTGTGEGWILHSGCEWGHDSVVRKGCVGKVLDGRLSLCRRLSRIVSDISCLNDDVIKLVKVISVDGRVFRFVFLRRV